jgi:ABC-type Mn2+/Zn2+ transport system ATPase subunit
VRVTAAIEGRGLRFGYGAVPVLEGLDVEVGRGQLVVLTGPNGSGKSTLIRLVVGLLSPDGGQVLVLGRPASDPGVRGSIGYAPQGSPGRMVLPVSVTEVVASGLVIGWRGGRRDGDVGAALDAVGMTELGAECVFELSGGQQQRTVIARALVGDRPVLILDEPTTGIDRAFRPHLVQELRRRADAGAAVVVVSHDPDDFHDVCDRILFMEDGRVQDVGHDEFHTLKEAGS